MSTDESRIPAAGLGPVDLDAIERASREDAGELRRLNGLIESGKEVADDIIQMAKILYKHGEHVRAEELLRANTLNDGDEVHRSYIGLFGDSTERELRACMEAFKAQFGVTLNDCVIKHLLKARCLSRPMEASIASGGQVPKLLHGPCEVVFELVYGEWTADISSLQVIGTEPNREYAILSFHGGRWI